MGEFTAFKLFLQQEGIQFKYNCPYTHHQNDVVERKYRYIVEISLTLLAQSHLPFSFWWEAFYTATYLINRMPTPTLGNVSPFQKLHNQIPDYQLLRVFYCSCFLLLKPYNQHKLDFHTQKYIFIVHSPLHKGYNCFDKSGKVFITRHLTFNESKFKNCFQISLLLLCLILLIKHRLKLLSSKVPLLLTVIIKDHQLLSLHMFCLQHQVLTQFHPPLHLNIFFLTLFFVHIQ